MKYALERIEERIEAEVRWYLLYLRHPMLGAMPEWKEPAKFFGFDCNEEAIRGLKPNNILTFIEDPYHREDCSFGRWEQMVAGVFYRGKTIYRSPGFDLEAYRKEQSSPQP